MARLLTQVGWVGVSRCNGPRTKRDPIVIPVREQVECRFDAERPDRLWVAPITYVPSTAGFIYIAVVVDGSICGVVGWVIADHLRTEFVLHALDVVLRQQCPYSVIHYSDQGCQFTSVSFG